MYQNHPTDQNRTANKHVYLTYLLKRIGKMKSEVERIIKTKFNDKYFIFYHTNVSFTFDHCKLEACSQLKQVFF